MRTINTLLAILVSVLLALVVFEVGLRLIGFAPVKTINRFDPQLGWSKDPGIRVRKHSKEYDVTIEINELGLRDDPMESPTKPAGTYRVVCLGDSFTLGYTVERPDLFVDQLEGWWNSEGREVDVINAGTEGYSTDQEVVWLLEHGAEYQPDLVLLFAYENDIYWNSQERYFRFPKPRFAPDGSLEARSLEDPGSGGLERKLAIANFLHGIFGAKPAAHVFTPEGGRPILSEQAVLLTQPPGFVTDSVKRTEGALRTLKAKCDELGSRLVVVPIPSHAVIDPDYRRVFGEKVLGLPESGWSPDQPVNAFLGICRNLGIDALDCRPVLKERHAAGEKLYYDVDWHLNPDGNRALATFLHGELASAPLDPFPVAHAKQTEGALPAAPIKRGGATWPKVYAGLWVLLTALYYATYRDEPRWQPPLKVGGLLAVIFTIVLGGDWLLGKLPVQVSQVLLVVFVVGILGFVAYKLGRRLGTILELFTAFTRRGHWYLMPLVVVLLTIGSLLVVAASSPLVAPFIYTLF